MLPNIGELIQQLIAQQQGLLGKPQLPPGMGQPPGATPPFNPQGFTPGAFSQLAYQMAGRPPVRNGAGLEQLSQIPQNPRIPTPVGGFFGGIGGGRFGGNYGRILPQ